MPQVLRCSVRSIEYFNHDTRKIVLDVPSRADVSFNAGQYLELHLPEKKCPFSIASSPHQQDLIELHIRPTPGSEDSVQIEAMLDNASELTVTIPRGDCFLTKVPQRPLILIAASTGVTQMKSILEFVLHQGIQHPVALYWGVVADSDLYMNDLCESWAVHDLVTYVPVVSDPDTSPSWTGRTGLVGEAALTDFRDLSDISVVVGGGPAMVYATLDRFVEQGMAEANMQSDIFSYAPRPTA
ncbi:MAG: NAD(P)H-flavin reductase [Gammaproteobacteria bacterium]|nr:NAD(P)H-flavin reductase [Gammaproteobacteria bacterium]